MISSKKFKSPEEEAQIKEIFRANYWVIREIYKHQASLGTSAASSTFAISLNQYTEFVKSTGLMNIKQITQSEVDMIFIVLNKRYKKTDLNPGNAIIRFQFLEALLKFSQKKAAGSGYPDQVIQDFIQNSVIPTHKYPIAQEWRREKYWNEFVDNLYKAHEQLLKEVYARYSGAKTLPGQAKFMDNSEFDQLFDDSLLLNDQISNRDVNL